MITYPAYKVAAMHLAPAFLDTDLTVDKVCSLIEEAARNGECLIAFSEAYVPAFPIWSALRESLYNHGFFKALAAIAMRVTGPEMARNCVAVRKCKLVV